MHDEHDDRVRRATEFLKQQAKLRLRRGSNSADVVGAIRRAEAGEDGFIDADLIVKKPMKWGKIQYQAGDPFVFNEHQIDLVLGMADRGNFALSENWSNQALQSALKPKYQAVEAKLNASTSAYKACAESAGRVAALELQLQQEKSAHGIWESRVRSCDADLDEELEDALVLVEDVAVVSSEFLENRGLDPSALSNLDEQAWNDTVNAAAVQTKSPRAERIAAERAAKGGAAAGTTDAAEQAPWIRRKRSEFPNHSDWQKHLERVALLTPEQ